MHIKYITIGLFLIFIAGETINAQQWNLPPNRKNTRHSTDYFNTPRPALSVRGFDNTATDQYVHPHSTKTFGVKQLLEHIYGVGQSQDLVAQDIFAELVIRSEEGLESFLDNNGRDDNREILEARAFVALVSLVTEANPTIFTSNVLANAQPLPSHSVAVSRLKSALLAGDSEYFRLGVSPDNAFKRGPALMQVARAWDLYLALENAYEDLGSQFPTLISTQNLLNSTQKIDWNLAIRQELGFLWHDTQKDVANILNLPHDVQTHEVQAGNWPLISFLVAGYVTLGFNGYLSNNDSYPNGYGGNSNYNGLKDDDHGNNVQSSDEILAKAMKSSAFHYSDSNNKRYNYWWFQTAGGKEFFAEGSYYLNVAMQVH